jgi:hypothetical protein
MLQIVRGWVASVTSARTSWPDPCTVIKASCAAGLPPQLACIAAQVGTMAELADGLGFADGLWSGVGDGLSEAMAEGLAIEEVGLCLEATPFELPQPASASMATKAASLIPTGR